MFNDGIIFFLNSKDIKLEGLGTTMSYEMGNNIYDFDYDILRHYNYEFLIFFMEVVPNEFVETFTGTKYKAIDDEFISEDSLESFSLLDMVPYNMNSYNEFKKQCERTSSSQIKRKMKKVYRKNRKANKKNKAKVMIKK